MPISKTNQAQRKNLKRFGIISAVIFSAIVILSAIYIRSCDDNTILCNNLFIQSIHIIILTAGLIGLGYCLIILRSFDVKVDPETVNTFNKIVKDLEVSEDKTNLTYGEHKSDLKKIDLFF